MIRGYNFVHKGDIMLRKTFLAIALGTAGVLATPAAQACVWTFGNSPDRDLGATATIAGVASPGTSCASSVGLSAFGTPAATLWNKFASPPDPNETGIGLSNDPTLPVPQHEIAAGSGFVQISLANVLGSHAALSIDFSS